MKDYLGQSRWWNEFPKNPTQTAYLRFLKTPKSGLPDPFKDRIGDVFKSDRFKTTYSDLWDGGMT